MVTSWVVSVVLILLVRWLVGKPSLIPTRGQLIIEECIGMLRGIIQPIVGRKVFFPSFWLLSGLFFFILVNNISGLFPGVGTIGYGQNHQGHFSITEAWIRPGNADLNMTLALAAVANLTWLYLIFKYAGLKVIIKDWFGNKADKKELNAGMFYFLGVIFIAVGFIEVISIIFRPVSLTFRLFGNVFGGESLLHSMFHLGEKLDFPEWLSNLSMVIVPIPFYMLEVLIGVVQALVFMLLVSVYIGLICNHGDEEHH
jgi:F-type H+-transporting ATPase subunit a